MNNNERDLFRLEHMRECIQKITAIVNSVVVFDVFEKKWIEQDAMIRNFEILGEAANHISDETKSAYPEIEWFKIRGMRNFMTHEYFGIRMKTIWDTAIKDIPILGSQIDKIIAQFK
ncbi:MAG: hypothetical protein BGN92_11270 [Sphingobacteriales bacterium 41-5]|nr:MAG: hypothetical protein BGN92_11270 [Sphingobacteriales bacterium 41-5]